MPRMTIYRSEFLTVALLLGGAADAMSAAAAQAKQPAQASYTVRAGDTLWSISQQLLGDPFLWPQIYRFNTQTVEDPHWIYPGEVLTLIPSEETRAVSAQDTPPPEAAPEPTPPSPQPERPAVVVVEPSDMQQPTGDTLFAKRRGLDAGTALRAYREQPYKPLRRGEFFAAGYLTEGQRLPFGRLLGVVTPPQIRNLSERATATLYTTVAVSPPEGASYQVNDSLMIVQTSPGPEGFGDIVQPTGMLRITGHNGAQVIGSVVSVFGPIRNGQLVVPADKFVDGGTARAQPVANGVSGTVLSQREVRELKHPQQYLFIDVGTKQGVARGDVFEIRRDAGPRGSDVNSVDELMAVVQVVHVRERTATVKIQNVISPDIPPGTRIKQVGKLP